MSRDNKFKNVSQDERRHMEQHEVHPSEDVKHPHEKTKSGSHSKNTKKK